MNDMATPESTAWCGDVPRDRDELDIWMCGTQQG